MFRRSRITLVLAPLLVLTVSCVGDSDAPTGQPPEEPQPLESLIEPEEPIIGLSDRTTEGHVWANPLIENGAILIPLVITTMADHFHFEIPGPSGPLEFFAYEFDGRFRIRAAFCPGCGGNDIDYADGALVCPSCGARFDPQTGEGLTQEWSYPTGSMPATVRDGYLKSSVHSLTVAYQRTAWGEETLYKGPATAQGGGRGGGCSSCG
jgi:hypothetical protein